MESGPGLARGLTRRQRAVEVCPRGPWRERAGACFTHPVRRSELIKVLVFCPHFQRPVSAARNLTIDRLVSCDEAGACRDATPEAAPGAGHEHARVFPHGCPVYPSLAK